MRGKWANQLLLGLASVSIALLFCFLSVVGVKYATHHPSIEPKTNLQTIITLDHYQGSLPAAINEIAKQCNLNSGVSHELVDKKVELDIHGQSAEFALNNICLEFKCNWEIVDDGSENGSIHVYSDLGER